MEKTATSTASEGHTVKMLRRQLESWREVLVVLHSLLVWDKPFYPAITASSVSIAFLLVWYLDPSVLTLVSLAGLTITLADFLVPQVVPLVVGGHSWTGEQERRYEVIVNSIASAMDCFASSMASLTSLKASRPKIYFFTVTITLLTTAWLGSSFNNLFLTYFIMMVVLMLPGLHKRGLLHKSTAGLLSRVSGLMNSKAAPADPHAKLQ
ncbi:ADP-ribosylation factor-like protein 6-interacting protein 1 isoform X2 [Hyalella azteca]|uniref:ADP-ribosylation factor-like protein 6-interacting protein 1 isoform X2 n=1 Tax=Hyalella azteca TaxID=294128 RepID=A0A8B7MZ77_HYAAZ|nr:ADP-ribosylation factor-like protein 6-interacting protein 1 isoform X2 [Hyalella azteca]